MSVAAQILPHVNAGLNAAAAVLLLVGYVLIRRGREYAHRQVMLASFGVSIVFLVCYLVYHFLVKQGVGTRFPSYPPTAIRVAYYLILLSHVVLAAIVPFMAVAAIYFGLKDQRIRHRRVTRWAWPIWLYVSVTGVIVYLMLYHVYPPRLEHTTISASGTFFPTDRIP